MSIAASKRNDRYLLEIIHDDEPFDPRENCNLGKMVCWHRRYGFGDKHDYDKPQDFLRDIVSESLSAKEIITYVKGNKAEGLKLLYNKSAREWELHSYSDFMKKWYVEYSEKAPLNMNDEYLSDAILQEMLTNDFTELAQKKT